jgi:two-component system sensor histidine kinase KdpD
MPPCPESSLPESDVSEAHKQFTRRGLVTVKRFFVGLTYRRRSKSRQWLAHRSTVKRGIPTVRSTLRGYGAGLVTTASCSLAASALAPWMALDSLVMVYMVGVVVVAARHGRGPSIVAAIASSVAFDFLFTIPFFSLRIADPRLVITVGVMLFVGLVISELTSALRQRDLAAVGQARRVALLYSLTRDLARATDDGQIYQAACRHVARAVGRDVLFFRPTEGAAPVLVEVSHGHLACDPAGIEIAAWAFRHRRRAGTSTTVHSDSEALYLPLLVADRALGVMMVRPRSPGARLTAPQARFLGHCARQIAGAMERQRLVRAAHDSERAAEEEQLRNSLLASVSHDLRQPLMVIEAAASSLLDGPGTPANPIYWERVQFLVAEARQMSDTVNKILDMTRLESTAVSLERRWYPIETLVVGALNRVGGCLSEHVVIPAMPNDLMWVYVDALVFEKLLTNLLENAAKYSQAGSRISISAGCFGNIIEIRVTDEGCGLPPGDTEAVFRKFHRGKQPNSVPGIGLGLSICRAIVTLHGGSITAHRRPTAGAEFVVELPMLPGAPAQAEFEVDAASC